VRGQTKLFEIILALHPRRGLADLLDGGQQEADEDGDDCDDDEQFDQRERRPAGAHGTAP
jgi:hypothetical protein